MSGILSGTAVVTGAGSGIGRAAQDSAHSRNSSTARAAASGVS